MKHLKSFLYSLLHFIRLLVCLSKILFLPPQSFLEQDIQSVYRPTCALGQVRLGPLAMFQTRGD